MPSTRFLIERAGIQGVCLQLALENLRDPLPAQPGVADVASRVEFSRLFATYRKLVGMADVLVDVLDAELGFFLTERLSRGEVVWIEADGKWAVSFKPRVGDDYESLVGDLQSWLTYEGLGSTTIHVDGVARALAPA
jgi:hypothetical protein